MIPNLLNQIIATGLSEAEVGRAIGRDQSSVNRMRRGKQRPDYETGVRIERLHREKVAALPAEAVDIDGLLGELGAVLREDERTALVLAFERGPQHAISAIEALDVEVSVRAQLLAAAQASQEERAA